MAISIGAMLAVVGEVLIVAAAVTIVVAGTIALVGEVYNFLDNAGVFDWLGDVLTDSWNWLSNGFGKVVQKAKSVVQDDIIPGIKAAIDQLCKELGLEGTGEESEIDSELGGIASTFPDFACDKAADAMEEYLKKKKQKYKYITMKYPLNPGTILSLSREALLGNYEKAIISKNGLHYGIEYKGVVHCNVHPMGLLRRLWEADFWGPNQEFRTITPP